MLYSVLVNFTDLQGGRQKYKVGDTYPREGYAPTEQRIAELSSSENKLGKAVIEPIAAEPAEPVEAEKPKKRKRKE